jgi:hypothetical protein
LLPSGGDPLRHRYFHAAVKSVCSILDHRRVSLPFLIATRQCEIKIVRWGVVLINERRADRKRPRKISWLLPSAAGESVQRIMQNLKEVVLFLWASEAIDVA